MTRKSAILWLCKSRYMNHDVIADQYARLYELPDKLSEHAEVHARCLDYRLDVPPPVAAGQAEVWRRLSLPRTLFLGWFFQLLAQVRTIQPTNIIASSDCFCIIVGALIGRITKTPFYADLYDDYASFGLARIPGMRVLYTWALGTARGVITVSETLGEKISEDFPRASVLVLESTIDPEVFFPREKRESREVLGLSDCGKQKLVGICGGLNKEHGVDIVFASFAKVHAENPDVLFVVAGKLNASCTLPSDVPLAYIGLLPHEHMPFFFSAMDVSIVALADCDFGYYAFPQKAYEAIACEATLAVADVGALGRLFSADRESVYKSDSSEDCARVVLRQLNSGEPVELPILDWRQQAARLADFISRTSV